MKEQEILDKIKAGVLCFDNKAKVILFGSRARRESRTDSDWDLLILTSFPINEKQERQIRDRLFEVELETDQAISSIIHYSRNWNRFQITSLYQTIKRDGVSL